MAVDVGHPEVVRYLDRLRAAAAWLPPARRDELVVEIRAHLAESLRFANDGDESAVRAALDRLGAPEDIVAAEDPAGAGAAAAAADGRTTRRWGPLEIGAVLLLTAGSFLAPVVGPIAGIALAWASPAWRHGQKVVATVLTLLPVVLVVLLFTVLLAVRSLS